MRKEEEVKKLVERYEEIRNQRNEDVVDGLCELIFGGVEKILDKNLSVFLIILSRNEFTGCIDIIFELEEYESIIKSIENRKLLSISTDIKYFETTLEFCHEKLAELDFVESDIHSGDYNEAEISFVMSR